MPPIEAIIFDYDGTLAPTAERQYKWFDFWWNHKENKKRNKDSFPYENLKSFMEMYNHEISKKGGVQNVYDYLNLSCDMNDKTHPVWNAYIEYLSQNPSKLYPGVKKMITDIHNLGSLDENILKNKRLRLGINTNNTWQSVYKDLKKNNIVKYFDSFITEEILRQYEKIGNPDPLKKPSPISLALALGLIGSEGEYTIHVGDTLNDLIASQKIMRLNPMKPETLITIGVSWGYEGRDKLESGANIPNEGTVHFNHIVNNPNEITNIVKKYLKK